MTEVAQSTQLTPTLQIEGIKTIKHLKGELTVFNTSLVTTKTINILLESFNNDNGVMDELIGKGIYSIIFRDDGYPKNEQNILNSWVYFPDTFAAVCNLQHCIRTAIRDGQDPDIEHSEKAAMHIGVWKNILQGFFHETWHARSAIIEPEKIRFDKEFREADEDEAPVFAQEQLITLAKRIDIEPEFSPKMQNMIDTALNEEIAKIENDDDAPEHLLSWVFFQKELIKNGGVFFAPADEDGEGIRIETFKEFLHMLSDDAEDDPEWQADTIGTKGVLCHEQLTETANSVPGFEGVQTYQQPLTINEIYDDTPVEFTGVPQNTQPATTVGFQGVPQNIQQAYQPNTQTIQQPITSELSNIITEQVVHGFYMKLYTHIFQNCRFNPQNLAMPFENINAITEPIMLDAKESTLVKEMRYYENNKLITVPTQNLIRGTIIDKAGTLPGYDLTLLTPMGDEVKRKFIPQNINKASAPGQEARNGAQIMWIIGSPLRVYNGSIQKNLGNYQWG